MSSLVIKARGWRVRNLIEKHSILLSTYFESLLYNAFSDLCFVQAPCCTCFTERLARRRLASLSACLCAISAPLIASSSTDLRDHPKSPNAFILFRSYYLAHPYLLPPDVRHQKDVSRYVAWVWRELPDFKRQEWFAKAQEEKERREAIILGHTPTASHLHTSNVSPPVSRLLILTDCFDLIRSLQYSQGVMSMGPMQPSRVTIPGLDDLTDADLQALIGDCLNDMPF